MSDRATPLILVVCNDYGELALALYLLERQGFAEHTTLMLPPKLYATNAQALPGRTRLYNTLDDIQQELDHQDSGVIGFLSGYLLAVHGLCEIEELLSLLERSKALGWKHFTSDPFLGLLEEVPANQLVTLEPPKWSLLWSLYASSARKKLSDALAAASHAFRDSLHIYPFGKPKDSRGRATGQRLYLHNSAFFEKPHQRAITAATAERPRRWLFILGNQDHDVQRQKYGRKFIRMLTDKLHETLAESRLPTLIAPEKVIDAVRKRSPVADSMELFGHCKYSRFKDMLGDAEYVFYWNAVSFSCIQRVLATKPWFCFDEGHLLRGFSDDYRQRIGQWFYRGYEPPLLDMSYPLSRTSMLEKEKQYLATARHVRDGFLASETPEAIFRWLSEDRQANG